VPSGPAPRGALAIALAVCWEFGAGWLVGCVASLAVGVALTVGGVLDLQIGLANASLLDPAGREPQPLLASVLQTLMLLVILACDGHHALVWMLLRSYGWLPPGAPPDAHLGPLLSGCVSGFFSLSFAMLLPLLTAMLGVELCLAFLARLLPQVNMLMLGAPLKLALGWVLLLASLPVLLSGMEGVWESYLMRI
ncbi:MAG: flagellar biosynthetic protein FliR, partial [Candidatus Eremiobacterota bacterium]